MTDLELTDNGNYYDITFDSNGDFTLVDGLQTSLIVSFFTNARASSSEVANAAFRQGWWGDLYKLQQDYPDIGSKLWLLTQNIINQNVVNDAIAYTQLAYAWLTSLKYVDKVNVNATFENSILALNIVLFKDNSVVDSVAFNLWSNTIKELQNG